MDERQFPILRPKWNDPKESVPWAALNAIRDMMVGHVTNWPEPKKFSTAIALVDKTLHIALKAPAGERS